MPDDRDRSVDVGFMVILLIFILLILLTFMQGCATTAALVEAPQEFWSTTWNVLGAMLSDLWSLVSWL